jgi:CheY-like chemotaxis protein
VSTDKKRILVVDDSEDLRELYQLLLEEAGYAVDSAGNGVEGFIHARAHPADLIISDVVMPGMDGLELLQKLRSDLPPPVPPVILCSGFDMTEREALRRGALMFLRKPFARGDLLEFVARGLAHERVAPAIDRRERLRAGAARRSTRQVASARVHDLAARASASQRSLAELASGPLDWTRAYFAVGAALVSLFQEGRLQLLAASTDGSDGYELAAAPSRPELQSVLESGATLVLGDVARHPCFSPLADVLPKMRFFAGVPLAVDDDTPVGVLCLADAQPRSFELEDLRLLQNVARRGALLVDMVTGERAARDVPGRFGPGVLVPDMFAQLVELELRLLERDGGTMALAVIETADVGAVAAALRRAPSRERLAAGVWHGGRVGICKRNRDGDAAACVNELLRELLRGAPGPAVGMAELGGAAMPVFTSQDLMRLAGLALDRAIADGGGIARLALAADGAAHA